MASLVLARMLPVPLLAQCRKTAMAKKSGGMVYKPEAIADTVVQWQDLWDSTQDKAAWTKRLIQVAVL